MERDQEQQIARLTEQMRNKGVAPERDLWPDIAAEIEKTGNVSGRKGKKLQLWQVVAVAATVLLVVGAGLIGQQTLMRGFRATESGDVAQVATDSDKVVSQGDEVALSDLAIIEQALKDLTSAMAEDPSNGKLSQLANMLHQSRGSVLRRSTRDKVRWGWTN